MTQIDTHPPTIVRDPARHVEDFTAGSVMTAPAVSCREEAFFEEVAQILADVDISGLPVVDGSGRITGVVSERDLVHALGGPMVRLALRRDNHGELPFPISELPRSRRRARHVMSTPPIVVGPDTNVREMARLLNAHRISRLPVVEQGRPVGVLTRGDLLGVLARGERAYIVLDD